MGGPRTPTIAGPNPGISQQTGNMGGSNNEQQQYMNLVQQQLNQQNLPKSPLSQQFQGLMQSVNPSLFGNLMNTQNLGNSFLGYGGNQNINQGPSNGTGQIPGLPRSPNQGGKPGSVQQSGFSSANTGINNDSLLSALQSNNPVMPGSDRFKYSTDASGRQVVNWTDPFSADPNKQYSAHVASKGNAVPGGSSDNLYMFEQLFGDKFFDVMNANPGASVGDMIKNGTITEQQYLSQFGSKDQEDKGLVPGFTPLKPFRDSLLDASSPYNININQSDTARNSGYYGTNGQWNPIDTVNGPNATLQDGNYSFNGQGIGDIFGNPNGIDPMTGQPLGGSPGGYGGSSGGSNGALSIPQMMMANPQLMQLMQGGLNPQAMQTLLQNNQAPGVQNYNPSADLLNSGAISGIPGLSQAIQGTLGNNQGVQADNALGMGNTSYYDTVAQLLGNKFNKDNADLGEQFAGTGTGRGSGASLAQAQQRAEQTPQLANALNQVRQSEVGNQLQQSGLNLQGILGGQQNNNQLLSTLFSGQGQQNSNLANVAGQAGSQNLGLQGLGSSNILSSQGLNQQGANSLLGQQNTYQNNQNQSILGMNNLLSNLSQFNSGQYNQNNLTVGLANQAASQQGIQNQLNAWLAMLGQSGSLAAAGIPGGSVGIQQPYPSSSGGIGNWLGGLGSLLQGFGAIRGAR